MNLSLIFLVISTVLLISIILIRSVELKKSRFFLPKKVRFSGDKFIGRISLAVFGNIARIKKLIKRELSILPKRFLRLTHLIWSKTSHKIDKFYDNMHNLHRHKSHSKKNSDLNNHKGSVSIYWRSVSEDLSSEKLKK